MTVAKKCTLALAALAGLTALPVAQAQTPPLHTGVPGMMRRSEFRHPYRQERQPEINRAIRNLEQTSRELHRAERDFGGHRAKAAQLVDQALAELREAKRYDDTHGVRR